MANASRFLSRAALFGLTLLIFLASVDAWLAAASMRYEELKYQALFDRRARYENIVLGTSQALHAIDPRVVETEAFPLYNFAYAGANPMFYERWYQTYRAYHPAPRVILLSAEWFLFKPAMTRRLEQDSEYLPWSVLGPLLADPTASISALLMNRFPLIKERQALLDALALQPSSLTLREDYYQGYVPLRTTEWQWHYPYKLADSPPYRVAFERLLDTFAADGVKVVLVQAPEYLPGAGEHPQENARLRELARARGLPLLNYNTERRSALNDDRSIFIDWGHMTEAGSTRFGTLLKRDLAEIGIL